MDGKEVTLLLIAHRGQSREREGGERTEQGRVKQACNSTANITTGRK